MTLGRPRCVFPTCRNERKTRGRDIWCAFHSKRMQTLADAGRRQRERDGGRGPEFTVLQPWREEAA